MGSEPGVLGVIPAFSTPHVTVYCGDALTTLREMTDASVDCVVTSPPYWGLRDYAVEGQLGLERTPAEYVAKMVEVFREARRVLSDRGTLWLNMGDSYFNNGLAAKQMVGMPWRLAFALQDDGWWLRSDIVWSKPNPMPESVTDRPTKAHEYVFLMAKAATYHYNADAIRTPLAPKTFTTFGTTPTAHGNDELGLVKSDNWARSDRTRQPRMAVPDGWAGEGAVSALAHSRRDRDSWNRSRFDDGKNLAVHPNVGRRDDTGRDDARVAARIVAPPPERGWESEHVLLAGANARTVWEIATQGYPEAHFATFPEELARRCILAGCPEGGTTLDPFAGSGTTLAVARDLGRKSIGIELSPEYVRLIEKRCCQLALDLA